jgi:hypothetical protein
VIANRLEQLATTRYVSPYHLAYVFTGLHEQERALDYLEQALAQRADGIHSIRGSFLFRSLHEHPRYVALLKQMNLA